MAEHPNFAAVIGADAGPGFFGLEMTDTAELATLAIFGAATATPYISVGAYCEDGPQALREASRAMAGTITNMNFDLNGPVLLPDTKAVDLGDLPISIDHPAENRALIETATQAVVLAGAVPVLVGGDDSVPIPFAAGLATTGPLSVLQIDAHIDWRNEVAGEPLGLSSTMRRLSEMPHIDRMVQVGRRGAGSATAADLADATACGVHFVAACGLDKAAITDALNALPQGGDILICLDVDAFDPSIVPSVIGRSPGGLTYWQVADLLDGCAARGRIAGLSLTEFMPRADIGGLGALTVTSIMAHAIGLIGRQAQTPKDSDKASS